MYYTVITHSGHLRTFEKSTKTRMRLLFSTFPSCFQMTIVFYHSVIHGLGFFICSVFDERCCFVDQRFEIVVNKLRDAFGGVTVARNNGASGVTMFVYFR